MTLDPEVNRILAIIDARIDNHADLLSGYLSLSELEASVKTVTTIKPTDSRSPYSFHWMRSGTKNCLPFYNSLAAVRMKIQSRTVCAIPSMYKERETLLYDTNLLCFELAYELFSQSCLATVEGDTPLLAKSRIQAAYQNLCDAQKMLGFTLPPHVQSFVLVFRATTEPFENIKPIMDLFNQALALADKHTIVLHQIDITLRKIDCILSIAQPDSFLEITCELKALFKLLKTIKTETSSRAYCPYIVYLVLSFIAKHLALSQEAIGLLPSATFKSLVASFTQQLEIIDYLEETFLKSSNLGATEIRSKELIHTLKVRLNNGKTIIAGFQLEETLRKDLILENEFREGIHLLIPKVLLSQADVLRCSASLIAPGSPLISLVVGCNQMLKYSCTKDKQLAASSRKLQQCYLLIAEQAKLALFNHIPNIIKGLTCQEGVNVADWFHRFTLLIDCLNNAHSATGAAIAKVHIPLIEDLCNVFPDNSYLFYTLYRAMADNVSRETPSLQLIAACRMAAEAGHIHAQYYYSRILESGYYGADKNLELANIYLQKSCAGSYYRAQIHLAKLHHQGLFGTPQKPRAILLAEDAMLNEETPMDSRIKLVQRYDILFIPSQRF